ncbi:3-phytase [Flavobacterium sediminis]|uniref:3-phytase n=1 Tax=Flavobacterium sediminis TaxID=2201181 RepID=A0A2U8QXM3_9FLAO|nr:phytase [Flavobacterium sediminis]AWM14903.1 3-phytase [Flavobacterium sediminis]
MKTIYLINAAAAILAVSCQTQSDLTPITPDVITEKTINDTDDPAIWVNPENSAESIVFGTDKETDGAIYAFDLEGKIIEEKTLRNMKRPNNIDLVYQVPLNDSVKVDIIAFTEREEQQIRVFSVPDMQPLDKGGFKVFEDETNEAYQWPMGIALYHSPTDHRVYAIVGRKEGPAEGYLYQYELQPAGKGLQAVLVRKFGKFSGKKEIEAIAVDAENGYIYYSDEEFGVRKYYAEPSRGNQELSVFGQDKFLSDIEGIAIAKTTTKGGYIIVSDQQRGTFNVFDRQTNAFIKAVNLTTVETDGCDVVTTNLGTDYPKGLFVAMNDTKEFYFYDFGKIIDEIEKTTTQP